MSQPRHTVDQMIAKLRRADVEPGKGKTVPDACKVPGLSLAPKDGIAIPTSYSMSLNSIIQVSK